MYTGDVLYIYASCRIFLFGEVNNQLCDVHCSLGVWGYAPPGILGPLRLLLMASGPQKACTCSSDIVVC